MRQRYRRGASQRRCAAAPSEAHAVLSFLCRRIMLCHTAPAVKPTLNATHAMITAEKMVIPVSIKPMSAQVGWRT
jgi:hypothetical protein